MRNFLIYMCLVSLAISPSICKSYESQRVSDVLSNDGERIEKLEEKIAELQKEISLYKVKIQEYNASSCLAFGNSTGIHVLNVPGIEPFPAPCESRFNGGGWTVIQRRLDGSVNFMRSWNEYRNGFGDLNGEFFIGLEKLHKMTISQNYKLEIALENSVLQTKFVDYSYLKIDSEENDYMLKVGQYEGGYINDGLSCADGAKFTTFDRKNDDYLWGNYAKQFSGGWWFRSCSDIFNLYTNLNGIYRSYSTKGIFWGGNDDIKSVQMMIRPRF